MKISAFLACLALISAAPLPAADAPLTASAPIHVFAAESLAAALGEVGAAYEKSSGQKLQLTFGTADKLAAHLAAGGPADVIISADEATLDVLDKKEALLAGTRQSILSNGLVLAVPSDDVATEPATPADLAKSALKKLALVSPDSAPLGRYARAYLEKAGLWDAVKGKVLPVTDMHAAVAAVESHAAEAAIIFKTDALASKRVRISAEIPAADAPPISYALAVVKATKQPEHANRLKLHLASPEAAAVFEKFGFTRTK